MGLSTFERCYADSSLWFHIAEAQSFIHCHRFGPQLDIVKWELPVQARDSAKAETRDKYIGQLRKRKSIVQKSESSRGAQS